MLYRSVLSLGSLLLAVSFHGTSAQSPNGVPRGTARNYAILTKTGVTTTGVTSVTGDMGTSPIAATAITGFALTMHSSTTYSTSALVTGKIYAASYTSPTPSTMTTAISDMETAYTNAASRVNPDKLDLGAGIIEGETLTPGLYKWGSSVGFTTLEFAGTSEDVWILQMTGDLDVGSGAVITLSGGALAKNIFWQVAGSTTLHTTAAMKGTILCATAIVFQTGSSLKGKALAQTEVTLDAAKIVNVASQELPRDVGAAELVLAKLPSILSEVVRGGRASSAAYLCCQQQHGRVRASTIRMSLLGRCC